MLSHNSRIWNRSLPRSKYALYFGILQLIGYQIIIKLKPKSEVKSRWNMLCFASNNLAICIKLSCNLHQIARSSQSYWAVKWLKLQGKRKEMRVSKPLNGIIDAKKAVFHFYLVMSGSVKNGIRIFTEWYRCRLRFISHKNLTFDRILLYLPV